MATDPEGSSAGGSSCIRARNRFPGAGDFRLRTRKGSSCGRRRVMHALRRRRWNQTRRPRYLASGWINGLSGNDPLPHGNGLPAATADAARRWVFPDRRSPRGASIVRLIYATAERLTMTGMQETLRRSTGCPPATSGAAAALAHRCGGRTLRRTRRPQAGAAGTDASLALLAPHAAEYERCHRSARGEDVNE